MDSLTRSLSTISSFTSSVATSVAAEMNPSTFSAMNCSTVTQTFSSFSLSSSSSTSTSTGGDGCVSTTGSGTGAGSSTTGGVSSGSSTGSGSFFFRPLAAGFFFGGSASSTSTSAAFLGGRPLFFGSGLAFSLAVSFFAATGSSGAAFAGCFVMDTTTVVSVPTDTTSPSARTVGSPSSSRSSSLTAVPLLDPRSTICHALPFHVMDACFWLTAGSPLM
mmetsp:Transcript_13990/g.38274  ORF Transcript_13990/g.38274 Transcript_13990/m.38274 type:complete len:219 (+) Transcript_13990:100-756(+)